MVLFVVFAGLGNDKREFRGVFGADEDVVRYVKNFLNN